MRYKVVEAALWVLLATATLWCTRQWRGPELHVAATSRYTMASAPSPRLGDSAGASATAKGIAGRNPFRLDRRAAPPPGTAALAGHPAPVNPSPPLWVSGMVGPPWKAVLEGVPGREFGVLVKAGDRIGDLRIRSIDGRAVIVSSPDTTWRLLTRREWN